MILDYAQKHFTKNSVLRTPDFRSGNDKSKIVDRKWAGFLTVLISVIGWMGMAEAQQTKVPRIGIVANNPGTLVETFRLALGELGYDEGKNILIEYRYIEGDRDRISNLVGELLQLKVDIVVATSPPTIRAAKELTKTIPIVIVTPQDPVANGIVDSFARPGGNITGLTTLTRDISGKGLELLKEVIPTLSRVGVIAVAGPTVPGNALREYQGIARALKISVLHLPVTTQKPDIEGHFKRQASNA